MAIYNDMNGFPESGFPILGDVSNRVCINTLYENPLKPAGFFVDINGAVRFGNTTLDTVKNASYLKTDANGLIQSTTVSFAGYWLTNGGSGNSTGEWSLGAGLALNSNMLYLAATYDYNHRIFNDTVSFNYNGLTNGENFYFWEYLDFYSTSGDKHPLFLTNAGRVGINNTSTEFALDLFANTNNTTTNRFSLQGSANFSGEFSDRNRIFLGNTVDAYTSTSKSSALHFYAETPESLWELGNDYALDGTQTFYLWDSVNSRLAWQVDANNVFWANYIGVGTATSPSAYLGVSDGTYTAYLCDASGAAGYFTDGTQTVYLIDGDGSNFTSGTGFGARIGSASEGGYFFDGTRTVYLCDGTYAINATGDSLFTGNIDVTTISVSTAAGIDATIPLAPDTLQGETIAGSMTFTKGILTAWTAAS